MRLSSIFKALREEFEQEQDAGDVTDAQREEYFKQQLTPYITKLPSVAVLKSNPNLAKDSARVTMTINNIVQKLKSHPVGSEIQDDSYAKGLVTDVFTSLGIIKDGENNEPLPFEESFKRKQSKSRLNEKYDIATGNAAKDSSGYVKSKQTKVNYSDQEKAQSKKQPDEMSSNVKSNIEKLIKTHISSAKWNSEDLSWTCKVPVKFATRTRLTGFDWFEKPQKLIDLENHLRSLYHNFIGRITWDDEGNVTIPLKNVNLTESRLNSVNSLLESFENSYQSSEYGNINKKFLKEYGSSDYFEEYEDAVEYAEEISAKEGVVQHVNEIPSGGFKVSDWYDEDTTLISFENGRELNEEEDTYKPKVRPNKSKYIPSAVEFKSALERIAQQVWNATTVDAGKEILITFLDDSRINDHSKKKMKNDIKAITNKRKLDFYVANSLLKFEKLGLNK